MLTLRIKQRTQVPGLPANPARLHAAPSFTVDIFSTASGPSSTAYSLAIVATSLSIAAACAVSTLTGNAVAPAVWVSTLLLATAISVPAFARKIATLTVHRLAIGMPFPTIGDATSDDPRHDHQIVRRTSTRGNQRFDDFQLHLALRETEPNVGSRLDLYCSSKPKKLTLHSRKERALLSHFYSAVLPPRALRSSLTQDRMEKQKAPFQRAWAQFLSYLQSNRTRRLLPRTAQALALQQPAADDLSPLVRLTLARIVNKFPPRRTTFRTIDEAEHPISKPHSPYYLLFKLNLIPIGYWILLLILAINLPLATFGEFKKHASIAVVMLAIIWLICTTAYNRRLSQDWRRWLRESNKKPFGNLPLFLYCRQNERMSKWEELDQVDFTVDLEELLMSTTRLVPYAYGVFVVTVASYATWFH